MAGLDIIALGADFGPTGWATGPALARTNFVGAASQAFVFDPSVIGSMWQDRAMTTPVTADGQPVRAMSDRSGKGQHAILSSGATGTPTWKTSGGLSWVEIPTGAAFEIANPMVGTDDYSVVASVRISGGTSATERAVLCQMGASSSSFLALQVGQRSGVQGMNLTSTAGWELTGSTITDGVNYCMGFRRNNGTLTAALRLNGSSGATLSYTASTVASQPTTILFGSAASSAITQTVSGRLYYVAFAKAARDDTTFAALEAVAKSRAGIA